MFGINHKVQQRTQMRIENKVLVWKIIPLIHGVSVHRISPEFSTTSLDEMSKILPGGAYTTLRTYNRTKVMRIEYHFLRLVESARRAKSSIHPQVSVLRPGLKQILNENGYSESRVRITLDLENEPGVFYVTLEELRTPPERAYLEGVRVISHTMQRDNPKAKLTKFLMTASKFRAKLPAEVNEMLMVDQNGTILEGLSSNFFGLLSGAMWTVEEGVLPGITRSAVLEIAKNNGIPVHLKGIQTSQLAALDECFITSASRGVLPVVKVDNVTIGSGKPGSVSQDLIEWFDLWVEKNVEEI